jgi:hypothetical protein
MLETPDYPAISRVMRVQPRPDDKPASGFSWGDYEDVGVDHERHLPVEQWGIMRTMMTDGDGEGDDNDGWGGQEGSFQYVCNPTYKELNNITEPNQSSSSLNRFSTKAIINPPPNKQNERQNAAKREAQKAAKASAEADRLATLAKHKRELERTKMLEQFASGGGGKGGKTSGG